MKNSGRALCLAIAALMTCSAARLTAQTVNTLSKKEMRQGWKLLFDGKDLQGWHPYLHPGEKPAWKVEDGTIMTDMPAKGGAEDLVTDEEYGNYELSLEWNIEEGGNSGIIFNIHEDPSHRATYFTGPEMQVLDNVKASDNKKENHLAGSLYDLIPADPKAVHPAGQWNQVKIRVDDEGHLAFWMNGKKVVETQLWTDQWKEMVAGSKFKNWKDFGTYKKGHIALQFHGGIVKFRNIKIRPLKG
ncbi:DUF1080 domain-containing protein [Compostibacter hankyongensis]|uniref:DUF1080 domain-containing protein n=1 Tax=Compostibacter hankyongensis TaxID=1007089 RepID=A0ABP8FIB6_9BACT